MRAFMNKCYADEELNVSKDPFPELKC